MISRDGGGGGEAHIHIHAGTCRYRAGERVDQSQEGELQERRGRESRPIARGRTARTARARRVRSAHREGRICTCIPRAQARRESERRGRAGQRDRERGRAARCQNQHRRRRHHHNTGGRRERAEREGRPPAERGGRGHDAATDQRGRRAEARKQRGLTRRAPEARDVLWKTGKRAGPSGRARRRACQQGLGAGPGGRELTPVGFGYPNPGTTPGRGWPAAHAARRPEDRSAKNRGLACLVDFNCKSLPQR